MAKDCLLNVSINKQESQMLQNTVSGRRSVVLAGAGNAIRFRSRSVVLLLSAVVSCGGSATAGAVYTIDMGW